MSIGGPFAGDVPGPSYEPLSGTFEFVDGIPNCVCGQVFEGFWMVWDKWLQIIKTGFKNFASKRTTYVYSLMNCS